MDSNCSTYLGSRIVVCARVGGANTTPYFLAAYFAERNTKFGGGKKLESESEGGKVLIKVRSPDFRQKKFGF